MKKPEKAEWKLKKRRKKSNYLNINEDRKVVGRKQPSVCICVERKHDNNEGRLKVKFPNGTNMGDIRRIYKKRDVKKD